MSDIGKRAPKLFSVVIPARDEEGAIADTVIGVFECFREAAIDHEILVVDDGSRDGTPEVLAGLVERVPTLKTVANTGAHGFGRAVVCGLDVMRGDAVVIMMADDSDNPEDAVRYWAKLQEGVDCVFGSRFIKGGEVVDYPRIKLLANRMANLFIKLLFNIRLNDTTNAFKAYRAEAIEACRPLLSPHFNLTVELPLKAIVRGFSWEMIPISWRNRQTGVAKLKIKEMGSRYLFIVLYVWLEKYFSWGDYRRPDSKRA